MYHNQHIATQLFAPVLVRIIHRPRWSGQGAPSAAAAWQWPPQAGRQRRALWTSQASWRPAWHSGASMDYRVLVADAGILLADLLPNPTKKFALAHFFLVLFSPPETFPPWKVFGRGDQEIVRGEGAGTGSFLRSVGPSLPPGYPRPCPPQKTRLDRKLLGTFARL